MATDADIARGSAPRPERRPTTAESGGNPLTQLLRFARESWAELKKVEWPGQNQVVQGTVVVLVACVIVGAYLWLNDQLWKRVVEHII